MRFPPATFGPDRNDAEKRLTRVLSLLRLEQHPSEWSRAEVAQYFHVRERMIDKDLQKLRAVGYDLRRHRSVYEKHATPDLPALPRQLWPVLAARGHSGRRTGSSLSASA